MYSALSISGGQVVEEVPHLLRVNLQERPQEVLVAKLNGKYTVDPILPDSCVQTLWKLCM